MIEYRVLVGGNLAVRGFGWMGESEGVAIIVGGV